MSDCARNNVFLDERLPFVMKGSDSVVFGGYKLFREGFLMQLYFMELEL